MLLSLRGSAPATCWSKVSDYPATLSGVNLWLDGRAQAYSDAAGTVPASAPLGRVARIDQPSPLSGSWLSPNTTDARPFREVGALRLEPVPTTGNYTGLTMNAPAGVTLPANACTISGSFLGLTSPLVQPGTVRGVIYGLDGGGQAWGPIIVNGVLCAYYGGALWNTGLSVPLFTKFSYVLRYNSTGLDVSVNIDGTVSSASLTASVAAGTISGITTGAWPALNGIGPNQSLMQVVGVNRRVNDSERDLLLAWLATQTPPDPFPATSYRLTQSGDSIGANYGINAADGCEYKSLPAIEAVRPDIRFLNLSVPSDTILGQAAKFSSVIAPLYSAICPLHVHVIQCGTNSLATGSRTIAQNIADTYALCDAARALGTNVKIVVATLLPRSDAGIRGTYEADRQTYNTEMRANAVALGHAHVVWDVCVSGMGAAGDSDNLTNFQSDKVHPAAAGFALLAPGYLAAVLSFSPPTPPQTGKQLTIERVLDWTSDPNIYLYSLKNSG